MTTPDTSTEPRPRPWLARVSGVVAVGAAAGAIALVGVAVASDPARPTTMVSTVTTPSASVPSAARDVPPTTVTPTVAPAPADASPTTSGSTTTTRPTTTVPIIPTTAPESAPTPTTAPRPLSPPVAISTSRIDLDAYPIRSVGLEDNGELEVPDETEIGWYELGGSPGRPGVTVLAAHVSWNRTFGPFAELGTMEPGDWIEVAQADGSTRSYVVTERTMYPKDQLPPDRLWRNVGEESLALITCGGSFDDTINRYRDNIVVYAQPVD